MTSLIGLHFLASYEYARASVTISIAAVALPLLYQPFSKYVLISGNSRQVEFLFWRVQPIFLTLMLVFASAWALTSEFGALGIVPCIVAFAASQGWKDFVGELARSRGDIRTMQRLYLNDAFTTAISTASVLTFVKTAEAFLLCSAASSLLWSRLIGRATSDGEIDRQSLGLSEVYRYSIGVVGSGGLNSLTVATCRSAIASASPPALAGSIQFILDILQKTMALLGSAMISAALPETRRREVGDLLPILLWLMLAACLGLTGLAYLIAASPLGGGRDSAQTPLAIAAGCSLFIWSNRYRSTVMDLPLLAARTETGWLLAGAAVTWTLVTLFSSLHPAPVLTTLLALALMVQCAGFVSISFALRRRLVGRFEALLIVALPVLIISVAAAGIGDIAS